MTFVDLHRYFAPIKKDQEPSLNVGFWGRKFAGGLDWDELLTHRRVVLLAEASSGKSEEFRNQQRVLSFQGKLAFFIRIEELADQGFEAALDPGSAEAFARWRGGTEQAYFFLDSVDEARLNRKSFDTALKKFARDLDRAVERAFIFVSCRVTDWKIREDRLLIESVLPWREVAEEAKKGADPLLDPVFNEKEQNRGRRSEEPKTKLGDLLVVQLVPLSNEQCRQLAKYLGVSDPEVFMAGINQGGLDAFTERPGDVIDLADYWKAHGRFARLAEMVDYNISRKLAEADAYRPDNDILTPNKAREGAERIAAALTLGKSFTLRAPGHDPDPSLAAGALDPALVLKDWSDAQRNALLRRGIFAPSTYGRIRFHHRATQEYLAAQWLDRLLRTNCPREEVWNLIFAERYSVGTLVPSLRPAAAWLALRHPDVRDEILRREPLVLIRHGDPGSLSLDVKKQLLLAYARKHADADIADDSLDHRALWLFSEPGLADTIRQAWRINTREDFRIDLLRIIREGKICDCVDLARKTSIDETLTRDFYRIIAVQALAECDDDKGLDAVAKHLMKKRSTVSPRVASEFAKTLFPKQINVADLLALMDAQPRSSGTGGFSYALNDLYEQCGDAPTRKDFVFGLAELCLAKPFAKPWRRVSKRHLELAKHLVSIARREVQALGGRRSSAHVVRLLMAVERADRSASFDEGPPLEQLVQKNSVLQRALFWADVAEVRENGRNGDQRPIRLWQIYVHGPTLWQFGVADLPGLFEDLSHKPTEDDQRVALSAIVAILQKEGTLDAELPNIRKLIEESSVSRADLDGYLAPRVEDAHERKHREHMEAHNKKRDREQKSAKASWVKFGKYVRKHLGQLRNPDLLASWQTGAFRLYHLTQWLAHRTGRQDAHAPLQWRLLEEGFSRGVAEAYRDGMKVLWRVTEPERPVRKEGGPITVKHTTILAFEGVAIEAAEDPEWISRLTDDEAKIAALHGCLSEQGYPEWIDALIASHPQTVLPIVRRALQQEWKAKGPGRSDFLYRYARSGTILQPSLQKILFDIVSGPELDDLSKLDSGLRILSRLDPTPAQKRQIARTARTRLRTHERKGKVERALRYLALLLTIDGDAAVDDLSKWFEGPKPKERSARAELTLAYLFDRHDPVVPDLLGKASTAALEKLLRLAYRYIHPKDDQHHEGSYSPNTRDHAESARNAILTAILDRPGLEAYDALRRIALEPAYALRKERFQELARGKAERDSELPKWTEKEVVIFEEQHAAPVKTGSDLQRVVMTVLKDIQFQLDKGDVTSRPLLQRAKDEDEVRNWIVEQMNFRSRGRFHAYREAQVANKDRPDIIIASTAAPCEVGMEVKHGGKKWTRAQLENALRVQLANDYLKPASRRHGVFVMTNHGVRRWRDAGTKQAMDFGKLMDWLTAIAAKIATNDSGPIQVRCFGVDAVGKIR